MMTPIIRTARAEDDLIAIWLYIAKDNEAAANRLLDRIEISWQQLQDHPFSGAPCEDVAMNVRHLVVGEYVTFYRAGENAVEILRVLHGRRKIDASDLKPLDGQII